MTASVFESCASDHPNVNASLPTQNSCQGPSCGGAWQRISGPLWGLISSDLANLKTMESAPEATLHTGKRLLYWGVAIYTLIAILPMLALLIEHWQLMTLPHSYCFLLIAISPWHTLRGSNVARTVAGVIALFGALISFPLTCGVLFPDGKTVGFIASMVFPLCCFLANVFLLNKNVQAYVTSLRITRGLSANHWEIEIRK